MAKDDGASAGVAEEIETILQDGKKKELNFVLMKSKGGVVLKAGPSAKGFPKLRAEGREAGGMPAISVCGKLTVSGRTMNMASVEEEPPDPAVMRKLAGQSKKYFKSIGLRPAKMIMTLPNGEVIDSDSVPDEDEDTGEGAGASAPGAVAADSPAAPAAPAGEPGDVKAQLAERLRTLAPRVKEALARAVAGADRLASGLKAAGAELALGSFDKAARLMDAVEEGLRANPAQSETEAGLRESLIKEFNTISADLGALLKQGEAAVAGKAQQFVQMFRTEVDGDLKKARAVLAALQRFVRTEIDRLAPHQAPDSARPISGGDDETGTAASNPTASTGSTPISDGDGSTGVMGKVVDKVTQTVATLDGVIDKVVDKVKETTGGVIEKFTAPEDEKKARAGLEALGLSVDERNAMMEKLKTDPKAVETFKTKKMTDAGVPPERQAAMLKMSEDNPKAFAAALSSLGSMEKDGAVDISADAVQKSLEALEKAKKETEAKQLLADAAASKLAEVNKRYRDASGAVTSAQGRADQALKAIDDLKARVGDPAKLTPEARKSFADESRRLINENETAKAELAKAIAAQKQASMDYADASDKNGKAQAALDKAKEGQAGKQAVQDAKDGKKALIDAMTFGPLATGKLTDEDKAKFASAFAKNAKVADGMLAMTGSAKNPSALAANAGFLAEKASDGFADRNGVGLDFPPEQMTQMALNAARMGDEAGGDYFKNFGAYLDSGKQHAPDPTGGLDGPLADAKEETKRKNKVALARTQAMGAAAIKTDGTVDFNSEAAKGQMDHMMFHPGSLKTFTPQMNMKMADTKALFENPATRDKANETIGNTKLPANTAPGKNAARTLIAGTTGKDKAALTDNDAKAAVLGAMMTPLSQGPVGSCFSTAPTRAIRETDPLRAMDAYAKIATTGQFVATNGTYPANTRLPEGENPLMRSFEYSAATAAADFTNSYEKNNLMVGMFGASGAADNLWAIKGIVGDTAWEDSWDDTAGDWTPGIAKKLMSAVKSQLAFEYDAGPEVGASGGSGGDGHSSQGAYVIKYKGKALVTEAEYIAAMKEIALSVTGETETTPKGTAIVDHISRPEFVQSIIDSNKKGTEPGNYKPWALESGGISNQTKQALNGGTPTVTGITIDTPPPPPEPSEGVRTKAMLKGVMDRIQGSTADMYYFQTIGKNANHGFNVLPKDPSLALVAPPDSADKIEKNLVKPGEDIAKGKLPVERVQKLFEEQIRAQAEGRSGAERDLVLKALKTRPTTAMTPKELNDAVKTAISSYRDAAAQARLDAWFEKENKERKAAGNPELAASSKAGYLDWFKKNFDAGVERAEAALRTKLMKELSPPQVTLADSNWGNPEKQTFFVVAPDVMTGELMMWKKSMPDGTMTPCGRNWADAAWSSVD